MDCHLKLKIGSTFNKIFWCKDENGNGVDISGGYTFSSDLKLKAGREVLISFDINDDLASEGKLQVTATPEQTNTLPSNRTLEFDIKIVAPNGTVFYTYTNFIHTFNHITD